MYTGMETYQCSHLKQHTRNKIYQYNQYVMAFTQNDYIRIQQNTHTTGRNSNIEASVTWFSQKITIL